MTAATDRLSASSATVPAPERPPTGVDLERLPARWIPILYFALAYVALCVAFAVVAWRPGAVVGFHYHPHALAIVHLVTLGWITGSILGAFYLLAPVVLRTPMPARSLDYWAYGLAAFGMSGMVAHFWLGEGSGMAWSALMLTGALAVVAGRGLGTLAASPVPRGVRLHLQLAFVNLLAAGVLGVLLGFHKVSPFLPGFVLANVYAHAHLAAIGWASLMVVGMAYRLLPMVLPSAMPGGWRPYPSVILMQAGVTGVFVSLLAGSGWLPVFAMLVAAGFGAFLLQVRWMLRHPRPPAVLVPRPDYAVRHAQASLACLAVATILGVALSLAPASEWTMRVIPVYGVLALVGFLSQMVVGMQVRIVPLLAWYWAFAGTGCRGPVRPPPALASRRLHAAAFYLWTPGVPVLAVGLLLEAAPLVGAGAALLLAGTLASGVNQAVVLRHARAQPGVPPATVASGLFARHSAEGL